MKKAMNPYLREKLGKLLNMAYNSTDHEMKMVLYIHSYTSLFRSKSIFVNTENHTISKKIVKIHDIAYKWIEAKSNNSTYSYRIWTEEYYKSHYAKRREIIKLCIDLYINELMHNKDI